MYRPFIPGFRECVISVTGFTDETTPTRDQIKKAIDIAGGCYLGPLCKGHTTHLICLDQTSEKYKAVLSWNSEVKCISVNWLFDCVKEWKYLNEDLYTLSQSNSYQLSSPQVDSSKVNLSKSLQSSSQTTTQSSSKSLQSSSQTTTQSSSKSLQSSSQSSSQDEEDKVLQNLFDLSEDEYTLLRILSLYREVVHSSRSSLNPKRQSLFSPNRKQNSFLSIDNERRRSFNEIGNEEIEEELKPSKQIHTQPKYCISPRFIQ